MYVRITMPMVREFRDFQSKGRFTALLWLFVLILLISLPWEALNAKQRWGVWGAVLSLPVFLWGPGIWRSEQIIILRILIYKMLGKMIERLFHWGRKLTLTMLPFFVVSAYLKWQPGGYLFGYPLGLGIVMMLSIFPSGILLLLLKPCSKDLQEWEDRRRQKAVIMKKAGGWDKLIRGRW